MIDSRFQAALSVPSQRVRALFDEERARPSIYRQQVYARTKSAAVEALWREPAARADYHDLWRRSGVTAGVVGTIHGQPGEVAFQEAIRSISSEIMAPVLTSGGKIRVAVTARDIEDAHRTDGHALLVAWESSSPLGHDLGRLDLFYNLGLRCVQLTYNLRNLAGDGCTERSPAGLSKFGAHVVDALNARRIIVDVAHASMALARDVLALSTAPVCVSHGTARDLFDHDRGTTDDVLKAVGSRGGYVGVCLVAGFLQPRESGTLDDFADHVEHIARVAGIDAIGIGSDRGSIYSLPAETARFETHYPPGFPWHGFTAAHRTFVTTLEGYRSVEDWPNLAAHLALRGFNEDELRKILGLNFLRYFREVVG